MKENKDKTIELEDAFDGRAQRGYFCNDEFDLIASALRESMAEVERLKAELGETDFMYLAGIETIKRYVKQINDQDALIKAKDCEIAALKAKIKKAGL